MFFAEPVIGFRSWKLNAGLIALSGRIVPVQWEFRKATQAHCHEGFFKKAETGEHKSPDAACTCGLYSYHSLEILEDRQIGSERAVMGAVAAWGKICVHEQGFKAEYSRPLCLAMPALPPGTRFIQSSWRDLADKVAENYSIPLLEREDITAYAKTFGKLIDIDVLL